MEQLPVKIKGGNYVPNVKIMVFLCVLQKHYKNRGFNQFWPLFLGAFWVQKVGSITGPR